MNPYGIQQVDVPGLLSIYENAKQGRAAQMKAKREEDRAAERESVMSRLFAPKSAPPSPGGATGAMEAFGQKGLVATPEQEAETARLGSEFSGSAPAYANDPSPMAPQSVVDPAQLPPRTDGVQLNPDALRDLYRIAPDTAFKLQASVYNANKQQLEQMQANGEAGLGVVYRLKRMPMEQRAAALQRAIPLLQSMGIDASQLAQANLTDDGLAEYESVFGGLAAIQPKLRNAGPGDYIMDENRLGLPGSPIVYESPLVKGEDGVLYQRTPAAPQGGGQSPEELRAAADEAIRQGADPAAVNARLQQMLGGGAGGNAGGNFP